MKLSSQYNEQQGSEEDPLNERHALRRVFSTLRVILAVALIGTIGHEWGSLPHISLSLLIAAGSVVVGSFLGFLFGIPRANGPEHGRHTYQPNTNLEEVSDWLTKIIIGVSLVEMRSIAEELNMLVLRLSAGFDGDGSSYTFVWSLLLCYFFFGLVGGYLITRIFLPVVFAKADHGAALDAIEAEKIAKRVVQETSGMNAHAIELVEYQLSEGNSTVTVDPIELNKAILNTTPNGRSTIFFKARRFRLEKEQLPAEQRQVLERALPVFNALVNEDEQSPEPRFHTNYAQRAFIYLALPDPDYGNAKIDLDKAIRMRDKFNVPDHKHYELLRAMANLALAQEFGIRGVNTHTEIQRDLNAALAPNSGVIVRPEQREIIRNWLTQQQITDPVIERALAVQ
jgi:hypothetical protein